jgi:hypothetical protein
MEVTIFKTNVKTEPVANQLILYLQRIIPDFQINFDLEDCDNILRIEGNRDVSVLVIKLLNAKGIYCHPIL